MVSAFMIEAITDANCISVASDITEDAVGKYLADEFITVPCSADPNLWEKQTDLVQKKGVDVVFPSLDETLTGWAECKQHFASIGIDVVVSPAETIEIFSDKWKTYQFFKENNIPTPKTSLEQDYPLVKPLKGRGAVGVRVENQPVPMDGLISQELLSGTEYTVDVLCDFQGKPVYIVPRTRKGVVAGKSTQGQVQTHARIEALVWEICEKTEFHGPINLQCFELENGNIKFIEINPRIAGGMALSFAATENWVEVVVKFFLAGKDFTSKPVRDGIRMYRYYKEVFV
jgi:carbamoyl-phosphate synthase large subunit